MKGIMQKAGIGLAIAAFILIVLGLAIQYCEGEDCQPLLTQVLFG